MDATRFVVLAGAVVSLLVAGCAQQMSTEPAAQPPSAEPAEPPQVVADQKSEPEPAGDAALDGGSVDSYVQRIEQALAGRKPKPVRPPQQAVSTEPMPGDGAQGQPAAPAAAARPPADEPSTEPEPEADPVAVARPAPQSPVLANVQVRTSTPANSPPAVPAGVQPNGAIDTTAMPPALRDFLKRRPKLDDASYAQQLDERILWALAGDYDQARKPLQLVTAEQQTIANRFVEALIALREAQDDDMGAAAASATSQLAALQQALRQSSDLAVTDVRLCRAVRGFGQYDAIDPPTFVAGGAAEFVLYVEIGNFASEKRSDGLFHTVVDLKTQIVNKAGETIFELSDPDIADRCRNQRRDFFLPRLVRLPAALAPGSYVAKVTVTDKLGQKVAQARTTFELVARH